MTLCARLLDRAGELQVDEIERLVAIIQNPLQFKIPNWFLNRQKDIKTGTAVFLNLGSCYAR